MFTHQSQQNIKYSQTHKQQQKSVPNGQKLNQNKETRQRHSVIRSYAYAKDAVFLLGLAIHMLNIERKVRRRVKASYFTMNELVRSRFRIV